jgi:FMN phosphatase YigB (HAD superfamily)
LSTLEDFKPGPQPGREARRSRLTSEGAAPVPIRAVWFDVGEVLVDETREYGTWADWLGVPRHTFSAVFGAVIAHGRDHRDVFRIFRPGFDPYAERQKRLDAGCGESLDESDLYPDARPCLQALKDADYFVGIAANQPARTGHFLRALDLPVDIIATSDDWGVAKPDPAFFHKLVEVSGHRPHEIAYVGDRLDNDIRPAAAAGLYTICIKRGPWALILDSGGTAPLTFPGLSALPRSLADIEH